MDPTLTGGLAALGTFGGLVAVLVVIVRIAWPSLKEAGDRVDRANRRADDETRRRETAQKEADRYRAERTAALEQAAALQADLAVARVQLAAALAELDRMRTTPAGPL